MGRLLRWTAGVVGIAALARLLGRRREAGEPEAAVATTDPAAELRQKLDEARSAPADPEQPAGADTDSGTLAERRARIHAKAQEAIDEMTTEDA